MAVNGTASRLVGGACARIRAAAAAVAIAGVKAARVTPGGLYSTDSQVANDKCLGVKTSSLR